MNPSSAEVAIWFPQWAATLDRLRLPASHRQQYRAALLGYLHYCKQTRQGATVASARQFVATAQAQRPLGVPELAVWKEALNWFFRAGRKAGNTRASDGSLASGRPRAACGARPNPKPAGRPADVPPPAATDLGQAPWERRLIEAIRTRHYQWRTEQTYRGWAGRFAQWLAGRGQTVEAAAANVRDFLTELATRARVSASTQKQALELVEG